MTPRHPPPPLSLERRPLRGLVAASVAALTLAGTLAGCAPLLIGGAVAGGAVMFADRRTSGTQIEDQGI